MMNIFIMVLMAVFMVGFYIMGAPSQRTPEQETQYAVNQSDLRAVAECAAAVHNAKIKGTEFEDICVSQNKITSDFICLNSGGAKTTCEIVRNKKPAATYIVTATAPLGANEYNNMMEILERNYAESGAFGIFMDGKIISGGTTTKRTVPKAIISEMKLENGQLIYMTQYAIPDNPVQFTDPETQNITCPSGTVKTYRFGRWQCVGYNTKTNCAGDMIWDSNLGECIPDESRKPLCGPNQTAVMVDEVWECLNPFPTKTCPDNMVARLNYNTLEWECVDDPNVTEKVTKCSKPRIHGVTGAIGSTLRAPANSCTDCEKMITDPETCVSVCVPDPDKINNKNCYPGRASECSGKSRAFYFGFPNAGYISNVDAVNKLNIKIDRTHSQNRRFNCMDCGDGVIDSEKSRPPYVAICK